MSSIAHWGGELSCLMTSMGLWSTMLIQKHFASWWCMSLWSTMLIQKHFASWCAWACGALCLSWSTLLLGGWACGALCLSWSTLLLGGWACGALCLSWSTLLLGGVWLHLGACGELYKGWHVWGSWQLEKWGSRDWPAHKFGSFLVEEEMTICKGTKLIILMYLSFKLMNRCVFASLVVLRCVISESDFRAII